MPNMTLHVSRLGIFTETVEPRPVISAIYRDILKIKEKADPNMLCLPFFLIVIGEVKIRITNPSFFASVRRLDL
jgi:hypothetical protein